MKTYPRQDTIATEGMLSPFAFLKPFFNRLRSSQEGELRRDHLKPSLRFVANRHPFLTVVADSLQLMTFFLQKLHLREATFSLTLHGPVRREFCVVAARADFRVEEEAAAACVKTCPMAAKTPEETPSTSATTMTKLRAVWHFSHVGHRTEPHLFEALKPLVW